MRHDLEGRAPAVRRRGAAGRGCSLGLWLVASLAGCPAPAGDACDEACSTGDAPDESTGDGPTTGGPTTGEPTTGESGDTDSTDAPDDDPQDDACAWPDLEHAPSPVELDGARWVPIDITALSGSFTLDVGQRTATAVAELEFRLGPAGGRPLFDLRQLVDEPGSLDGEALAPEELRELDLGGGLGAEMRGLARDLAPCSQHRLTLRYSLGNPPGFPILPPVFDADGVTWDFGFSDLLPRQFLEQWLPANLVHDFHPIAVTVEVVGASEPHLAISNGEVSDVGPARWDIRWPELSTALSPMLVVAPVSSVESTVLELELSDGGAVEVELHRAASVGTTAEALIKLIGAAFDDFSASTGVYAFPRFTAYVEPNGGMEYDGGTTSSVSALRHEVFHSWYGRGLKPARATDGWIDEAWDAYNTDDDAFPVAPLSASQPPVALVDDHPWARATNYAAYEEGKAVFAAIAAAVGVEPLRASMRAFYGEHALGLVTTATLERHLHCTLESPMVRPLFNRFVYGRDGAPAPVPDDYCG